MRWDEYGLGEYLRGIPLWRVSIWYAQNAQYWLTGRASPTEYQRFQSDSPLDAKLVRLGYKKYLNIPPNWGRDVAPHALKCNGYWFVKEVWYIFCGSKFWPVHRFKAHTFWISPKSYDKFCVLLPGHKAVVASSAQSAVSAAKQEYVSSFQSAFV